MGVWFVIATLAVLSVLIYAFREEDHDPIGPAFLLWALLALFPSLIHTTETRVRDARESEYRIYITSPYSAILMTDIRDAEPDTKKITDAYTLMKLGKGEYKVVCHTHYTMWGNESVGPEYHVIAK